MSMVIIEKRLGDIARLKKGWYNGFGAVPKISDLNWLIVQFGLFYPEDLITPYFYPTPEGGVLVEWGIDKEDITMEIDLSVKIGAWHQVHTMNDALISRELDLKNEDEWCWVVNQIRRYV